MEKTTINEFYNWYREFKIDTFVFREPSVKATMEISKQHKIMIKKNKTDVEYYKMFLWNVLHNRWFLWFNYRKLQKELDVLTPEKLAIFFSHILWKLWLDIKKKLNEKNEAMAQKK